MRFFSRFFHASVVAFFGAATALGTDFTQTGPGTYDSNNGANWSSGVPSGNGQDVNFTHTINSGDQIVTNLFKNGGGNPELNYLRLAPGGSSLLTVITQPGTGIDSFFGLQLNARATLYLNGGFNVLSHGNNSFDNAFGTLILINGAIGIINIGANAVQNQGTIQLSSGDNDLNYGQSTGAAFNNSGTGTIVKDSTGTGRFTGNFGANNVSFRNNGTILVNSGTLVINPADAFDDDGFNNTSQGRIFVNAGATFAVDRSANAWNNDSEPDNDGRIFLNDGTLTVLFAGAQASDRGIQNNATISGSGTFALKILQSSTGNTIASNGVLNLFQTVAGNQQTFTSVGGQFGTFRTKSAGTMRLNGNVASGMGGAWIVESTGTLEVSSGNSVDLGAAFMPGGNLNGNVKVNSGANLTLSANTGANGQTLNQSGTFLFNGGSISMANVAGLSRFTNSATGVFINDGNGWFRTGYGVGQNNYGILNLGTIIATNGTLTLRPDDAANAGGFQNQGTVRVKSDGTLTITRTDNAWLTGVIASPTNTGSVILEGGTFRGSNTTVSVQAGRFVNASGGTITGNGTIMGYTTLENSGKIVARDDDFTVNPLGTGYIVNNAGGVISNQAVTFTANATVTNNGVIVNTGTFIVSASGVLAGNGGITNTSRIILNSTANTTYGGVIAGTGSLTKNANSRLILSGVNTYTGATVLNAGTLEVSGSIAGSSISVGSGALLTGSGRVGVISGSGRVSPGSSPGILTATQLDPTGGIDYSFEFTVANADPTWSNAGASGNDVQRLTHATSPFTANLTLANDLDIYFNAGALVLGQTYRGGFFTDRDSNFAAFINGGDYSYFVADAGGGITFNGQQYYTLAQYNSIYSTSFGVSRSVVQIGAADFAGGTVNNGWVQQFQITEQLQAALVPEPSMVLLFLTGLVTMYAARRRNRKR